MDYVILGIYLFVWGSDRVPLGCRCVRLPPLYCVEVGKDQSRVLSGDDEPSIPHTSHVLEA